MQMSDLRLAGEILRAVASEGYSTATPIQAQAIPHVMEGRDVLGCAQTGTGKTAAFALPILHRLKDGAQKGRGVRCLVLCPTRELATQIGDSFRTYGKHLPLSQTVIFGGVNQNPQVHALRRGVDILIATPGRLIDLLNQNLVDLSKVEMLVLDEADRMLDMGFIHDIRRIVAKLPGQRQTLLFSATMPTEIRTLADSLLRNPAVVQVAPVSATADRIEQSVYFVERRNKPTLLAHLVGHLPMTRAIVFTRTKHGADRVVRQLHVRGIRAEAIHGNKTQNARQRALYAFQANKIPVLVATDIASRGIDVDGVTHVVNYDLTHEPETYVHRIGRTGRAGAAGAAVSFCDSEERANLRAIEKLIRRPIPVKTDHPEYAEGEPTSAPRPSNGREARREDREQRHPQEHRNYGSRPRTPHANRPSHHPASRPSSGADRRGGKPFGKPERSGGASQRPKFAGHGGHKSRRARHPVYR